MPEDLKELEEQTRRYIARRTKNTDRAYRNDWLHFTGWCAGYNLSPLPAEVRTVCLYVATLAEKYKFSTIKRKLSAIGSMHRARGLHSPTGHKAVWRELDGIVMEKGSAQEIKRPIRAAKILEMILAWTPETLIDLRDRAILIVGYAGAFKRSELAELSTSQLDFQGGVLAVYMQKRTIDDQRLVKVISRAQKHPEACPVGALETWMQAAGITSGSVFRSIDRHGNISTEALSPQSISLAIKRLAVIFGIPPEEVASHSLRSGFITDMYLAGMAPMKIMKQTGLRQEDSLKQYADLAERLKSDYTAAAGF